MNSKIQKIPFYILLIPLFFVLHGCLENFGYIYAGDAFLLIAWYCGWSAVVFLIFTLLYRSLVKAGIATAALLGFFFFFGAIQDFFKIHSSFLYRYSVLLSINFIISMGLIIYLKKTKRTFYRLNFFLNLLLIIYLLIDGTGLISKSFRSGKINDPGTVSAGSLPFSPCKDCSLPDIYFLLFDAYTGSATLKEQYHYDNSDLDSFLRSRGFHIQTRSMANYKYTILSMPSILNMSYLDSLKYVSGGETEEYLYLSARIKKNELTGALGRQGYEILNCSPFDLQGNPSPVGESLLPLKTRLITDQTLYSRVIRDLGWIVFQYIRNPLSEEIINNDLHNNDKLISRVKAISAGKSTSGSPQFVYGHLNLPHPPYYFDRMGKKGRVMAPYDPKDEDDVSAYLDYLQYTNRVAKDLITTIQTNTGGRAVIIFMGDHGLRYHDSLGFNPPYFLQNQNAVYFPGKDYQGLYDSISGVNQFRVVLNTLFKQHIPLLKDSTVQVMDKK